MPETTVPGPEPATNGDLRNRVQQIRLDTPRGGGGWGGTSCLPWVLCILLAGSWAGVAIRSYKSPGTDNATNTAATGTSTKSAEDLTIPPVMGYLMPAKQIAVSPIDVGGRLIDSKVVEGKRFAEGEELARIDPSSYQAVYDESKATLAGAQQRLRSAEERLKELDPKSVRQIEIDQIKAQIKEAEAQESRAKDEEMRLSTIVSASGREKDQARNDLIAATARVAKLKTDLDLLLQGPRKEKLAAAQADIDAAQADVEAAKARLTQAKWRLENCVIKAPIAGTVLEKNAEKGNLVNPMAFGAGTGSLCKMADLADLEVDLEIPEKDISKLKAGQACRVKVEAFPDRTYEGTLDRIMPIANRAKSIVNVRVKVKLPPGEEPGTFLKPEMGARVSFLAK
jgi:multidrug resistance efflux pump